jgi:hypothetical protein
MDSANAEMKGPAMAENNLPREFLITPPTPETYRFVEFRVTRLDRFSTFEPIFFNLGKFWLLFSTIWSFKKFEQRLGGQHFGGHLVFFQKNSGRTGCFTSR